MCKRRQNSPQASCGNGKSGDNDTNDAIAASPRHETGTGSGAGPSGELYQDVSNAAARGVTASGIDMARQYMAEAQRHLLLGDLPAAERAAGELVNAAPDVSESHNVLGVVLRKMNRLDAAATAYAVAIDLDADNARARNNLGDVLKTQGRHAEARAEIEIAVGIAPHLVEAWINLAQCANEMGELELARSAVASAQAAAPDDPGVYLLRARIEHDAQNVQAAEAAYRAYLDKRPHDVAALTDLGMLLAGAGRHGAAIQAFEAALERDPSHVAAEFGLREATTAMVPSWHIPMMNEPKRNEAYRDAIRAMVRPSDHVLDLGTGAGLLSLLAAEAGARQVTGCEMVEIVAREAQAIVGRSAYADRIDIVAKKSTDLSVGRDMPAQADILVSEILANDFVGEGVIPSLIDARRRLLKPGARMIPRRGSIMGVLVGGGPIEYLLGLRDVCGFDMASFAHLRPWRQPIARRIDYDALSADLTLIEYDFENLDDRSPVDVIIPVTAARSGRCYGILQWIRLELAPGIAYDNHPRTTESVWNQMLFAFREPLDLTQGDTIGIRIWQQDDYLYVTYQSLG